MQGWRAPAACLAPPRSCSHFPLTERRLRVTGAKGPSTPQTQSAGASLAPRPPNTEALSRCLGPHSLPHLPLPLGQAAPRPPCPSLQHVRPPSPTSAKGELKEKKPSCHNLQVCLSTLRNTPTSRHPVLASHPASPGLSAQPPRAHPAPRPDPPCCIPRRRPGPERLGHSVLPRRLQGRACAPPICLRHHTALSLCASPLFS